MVAYSFAAQFIEPVSSFAKLQTVRGFRRRHARPGEPIQLYTAMRTRQCRKLVDPDPICLDVRHVVFELEARLATKHWLRSIEIEGVALNNDEIDAFAFADGFGQPDKPWRSRAWMGRFWIEQHGPGTFEGVLIRWQPQSGGCSQ